MRRNTVALTGGAALAAGLVLGYIADRLTRNGIVACEIRPATPLPARSAGPRPARKETAVVPDVLVTDILERYRVAAAV